MFISFSDLKVHIAKTRTVRESVCRFDAEKTVDLYVIFSFINFCTQDFFAEYAFEHYLVLLYDLHQVRIVWLGIKSAFFVLSNIFVKVLRFYLQRSRVIHNHRWLCLQLLCDGAFGFLEL